MKLYKISVDEFGYDEYDSYVVCAESEEEARKITPDNAFWPNDAKIEYLGEAKEGLEKGIIVASFNAG